MSKKNIIKFDTTTDSTKWEITDDVVMGGKSAGQFYINNNGYGVFKGTVSLENNGGFSSLRHRFKKLETSGYNKIILRVKGDGKTYQIRLKTDIDDRHAYSASFKTTEVWENIELQLNKLQPIFRGKTLDLPNFNNEPISQITFLIANKKKEDFILKIDSINLIQ